ncbi:MAG: DUF4328 domain-containing protein [Myxococcales bacterium]|nr:DUF4328 domain-containing protein [Myxococcales bacterium]
MASHMENNAYQAPATEEPSAQQGYTGQSLVLLFNALTFGSFCLVWALDLALVTWGLTTETPAPEWLSYLVDQTSDWTGIGFYACALSFVIFAYRASRNARALGIELRHSAGATIFWFLVPLANLFMPYQVMKELWSASSKQHSSGNYLPRWWLTYLVYRVAGGFSSAFLRDSSDSAEWRDLAMLDLAMGIPAVISAALAFLLLYDIHRRQNDLAASQV